MNSSLKSPEDRLLEAVFGKKATRDEDAPNRKRLARGVRKHKRDLLARVRRQVVLPDDQRTLEALVSSWFEAPQTPGERIEDLLDAKIKEIRARFDPKPPKPLTEQQRREIEERDRREIEIQRFVDDSARRLKDQYASRRPPILYDDDGW